MSGLGTFPGALVASACNAENPAAGALYAYRRIPELITRCTRRGGIFGAARRGVDVARIYRAHAAGIKKFAGGAKDTRVVAALVLISHVEPVWWDGRRARALGRVQIAPALHSIVAVLVVPVIALLWGVCVRARL